MVPGLVTMCEPETLLMTQGTRLGSFSEGTCSTAVPRRSVYYLPLRFR